MSRKKEIIIPLFFLIQITRLRSNVKIGIVSTRNFLLSNSKLNTCVSFSRSLWDDVVKLARALLHNQCVTNEHSTWFTRDMERRISVCSWPFLSLSLFIFLEFIYNYYLNFLPFFFLFFFPFVIPIFPSNYLD